MDNFKPKDPNEFKDKEFFVDSFSQRHKLSKLVKLDDTKHLALIERDSNPVAEMVRTPQAGYIFRYKYDSNFTEVAVPPDTYDKLKRYLVSKTI